MDSGCFSTRELRKGTTAKPLDGGVLPHRGARAPARGPAAAPWLLSLAPWLLPFRGERRQRGRMSLGFAGDAASPGFVPAKRALGRPILIVGDGRLGTAAGERAKYGPRGARRRAGLAAWPSAVGPKARASRAPSGLGRFRAWAASTVKAPIVFSIFQKHFNSSFE